MSATTLTLGAQILFGLASVSIVRWLPRQTMERLDRGLPGYVANLILVAACAGTCQAWLGDGYGAAALLCGLGGVGWRIADDLEAWLTRRSMVRQWRRRRRIAVLEMEREYFQKKETL